MGRRPVLLLSRNKAYSVRTAVTVALITRTIRSIPVEVVLGPEHGLPDRCVANLDEISTIPKALLRSRICTLDSPIMGQVGQAVRFALDLG